MRTLFQKTSTLKLQDLQFTQKSKFGVDAEAGWLELRSWELQNFHEGSIVKIQLAELHYRCLHIWDVSVCVGKFKRDGS